MQYSYQLNSVNQAKRMLENTHRPPLDIKFSNPQLIKGRSHPTSVSVDCNAGVYLSAVKPALEQILEGWQYKMLNTLITCDSVSPRNDISGRKVCTKLVLFLSEDSLPGDKARVVVHFYHTSNSILAQGSHLMSSGVSSPVWLVTHFIQPTTLAGIMIS